MTGQDQVGQRAFSVLGRQAQLQPVQVWQHRRAHETGRAVRIAVTALLLLRIGVIRVAAVVPGVSRAIHLVLGLLALSHVHITEPGLQRLGTDRQDKD